MLKHRLLMSALLIPATIGLFVWDHGLGEKAPILFVLIMILSARATWELVTLARAAGLRPSLMLSLAGTWAMIILGWAPHVEQSWGNWYRDNAVGIGLLLFGAIAVWLTLNSVLRFPRCAAVVESQDVSMKPPVVHGREIATLAFELFIVVYLGVFLAITTQLRWVWNDYFALGALVVAAKTGDIGAYTFGRLIGGPKMTPKLSPGKTWAGGVGHLVTAALCSIAWMSWLGPLINEHWTARHVIFAGAFGITVGFAGLIGDLAESLIKRDVGVKDAPALLPGFGGLLDLLDSLLLAGPVAYAMWGLCR